MEKTPEQLAAEEAAALEALEALRAKKEAGEELTPEEQAAMQAAQAAEEAAAALEALRAKKEAGEELTPEELAQLEAKPAESGEVDELVITLGEEALPTDDEAGKAPAWVRELRQQHKEQARRIRELEAERETLKAPLKREEKPKPTLESCGYDEERFARELTAWHDSKRQQEAEEKAAKDAAEAERIAWQQRLDAYEESKKELKLPDIDIAEEVAKAKLSITQQGIILHGSAKPALMLYVLGKNSKELDRLAAISDPVKFAFAVAQLEVQVKVTTKKVLPAEKMPPAGGTSTGAALTDTLEKLREEAHRTGDFTKLHKYKAEQREKIQAKA